MTCDSCEYACVKIKCHLSIKYETLGEKNLDYLYKSESEIKLKTNYSVITQSILQMAVTNRKLCYFVVWTPHEKVIGSVTFDDIMWKDIKDKLTAFYKDFYFRIFFRN